MTDAVLTDRRARRLFEHALLLLARQHGGDARVSAQARQAFELWRKADAAHEAAAQAALRGWAATEAGALRERIALPVAQDAAAVRARRRTLSALGVVGVSTLLGGAGRWLWLQPVEQLALQTAGGQTMMRTLADGSRLDLAPHTRARASVHRDRREVWLAAGEIRFDVRSDGRPFTVVTDWGHVRVLGTVFTVAVRARRMDVAVAEGRVAVWADRRGHGPVTGAPDAELQAGQRLRVDERGVGATATILPSDVAAWRQGWLVFNRTPLVEAVAQWNDYLASPLVLADDVAARGLILTGSFPLRDPAAFVASLPEVLPVRVERSTDGARHIVSRR
jgi:transmembrane sensor